MRSALLIALGLVIGIAGTAATIASMRHGPSFGESLMTLQGHHMHALDKSVEQKRCAVADTLPQLQMLRSLSNDIEPAFLPIENEQDFRQKAGDLRASLDAVLAAPPATCAAVNAAMEKIGKNCKACHDQFRS